MNKMKEKVYEYLDSIGITYEIHEHPPLYTCADHDKYHLDFGAIGIKNLFLRNHNKSAYYLVSMPDEKRIDLHTLSMILDEKKLSFASEEDLYDKLRVTTGSVSILNTIECDKSVIVVVDRDIIVNERVGFHPNENTVTIVFKGTEIDKILSGLDIEYRFMDLEV